MEPERGKSCFSGRREGPAAPGEDMVSVPDWKTSISLYPKQPGAETEIPRVYIAPRVMETPTPLSGCCLI